MQLTTDQLAELCSAPVANAATYVEYLNAGMARFQISDNPVSVAALMAHIAIESAHLTAVEEGLYYTDAARLAKIFRSRFDTNKDKVISPDEIEAAKAFTRNPKALSQKLYNGFHGRGLIQLTWLEGYLRQEKKLGFPYSSQPELVATPQHAALTACSFWDDISGNEICGDIEVSTRKVNGTALMHLAERREQQDKNLAFMRRWGFL